VWWGGDGGDLFPNYCLGERFLLRPREFGKRSPPPPPIQMSCIVGVCQLRVCQLAVYITSRVIYGVC